MEQAEPTIPRAAEEEGGTHSRADSLSGMVREVGHRASGHVGEFAVVERHRLGIAACQQPTAHGGDRKARHAVQSAHCLRKAGVPSDRD